MARPSVRGWYSFPRARSAATTAAAAWLQATATINALVVYLQPRGVHFGDSVSATRYVALEVFGAVQTDVLDASKLQAFFINLYLDWPDVAADLDRFYRNNNRVAWQDAQQADAGAAAPAQHYHGGAGPIAVSSFGGQAFAGSAIGAAGGPALGPGPAG